MSKHYYTIKYRCMICLEIYAKEVDVMESQKPCCFGEKTIQPIYECGECGARYTVIHDAMECCQAAD